MGKLTTAAIKAAKPRARVFNLGDGEGLQLRVSPSGSKLWIWNFVSPVTGRRVSLSLGRFPVITLAEARSLRMDAERLKIKGIDPRHQRAEQRAILRTSALKHVASQWLELKAHTVSPSHLSCVRAQIEQHLLPHLGDISVTKITAPLAISALRAVEERGHLLTVRRTCAVLNEIMDYCANHGIITANPCAAMAKVFKQPIKTNYPTLKPHELPELMTAIAANTAQSAITLHCLQWMIHTLVRPREAAAARWDELDIEARVWHIPAQRMKMKRPHRVPLTDQMLDLLEALRPISGHRPYLFPNAHRPLGHISPTSINTALIGMGFRGRLVAHGIRSLGSTTLNEQGFSADVIEAALSHVDANEVRRTYNRSDYFEQRVAVMQWWCDHVDRAKAGSAELDGRKGLALVAVNH
ncbi:MAG: tyrosine-type recombinase/integrase [Aeromonas sp.]